MKREIRDPTNNLPGRSLSLWVPIQYTDYEMGWEACLNLQLMELNTTKV